MSSAFERYLSAVAASAIASDPALTPGFPKKIDGLILTKYDLNAGERPIEPLTKDEWPSRLSAFSQYFGSVPSELRSNEGELEIIRKTRNSVAHAFGLDSSALPANAALLLGARRPSPVTEISISDKRLTKWLAIIDRSATAIDEYLLPNFIGGYELAAIYIEWNRDIAAFRRAIGIRRDNRGTKAKQLSRVMGTLLSHPVQWETAQEIMEFVDSL
jgi:hypothetical protein